MSEDSGKPGFKQKAKHEFVEFLIIAAYLAFFFCALVTYTMLLLKKYDLNSALNYGFAVVNALVIGKVILIGEMMHLGRGSERRPLWQSVLYKSVVFGVLVFAFHLLEEFVKRLIHGEPAGTVWHELHVEDVLARTLVIFCASVPLFAFRELRRVLGEEKMYSLLRSPGVDAGAEVAAQRSGR